MRSFSQNAICRLNAARFDLRRYKVGTSNLSRRHSDPSESIVAPLNGMLKRRFFLNITSVMEIIPISVEPPGELPEVIRRLIKVDQHTGCWLWLGPLNNEGYGRIPMSFWRYGIFETVAHLLVYKLLVGDVEAGKELHHYCQIKRCCRPHPQHVQALTPSEHQKWHHDQRTI